MKSVRGKGFLKVTGILMIIGGVISLIMAVATIAQVDFNASLLYGTIDIGLLILAAVVAFIGSILELVTGIIGVKNCGDPSKATVCIAFGFIITAISMISNIIFFRGIDYILLGLILPVLYLIGAFLNKNSVG